VSWIEVAACFDRAQADWSAVVEIFSRHGIENTLEIEHPPTLMGCVVNVPGSMDGVESLRKQLFEFGASKVSVEPFEEQNWEEIWKQFFKPRRIGRRFVIRPTWEEFESAPGDLVIVLDPGQAFGTGDHPTTRMCLELIEQVPKIGPNVLDIGCGSGILSIGSKLLGATHVLAVDIDPLAAEVTRKNCALNDVELEVLVSDGLPQPAFNGQWQLVVSNIISAALIRLAPDVFCSLEKGGRWLVSGILKANWPEVLRAALAAGFTLGEKREEDDWVAAIFLR
jgi:ribosomal protein L11 methyltransferase